MPALAKSTQRCSLLEFRSLRGCSPQRSAEESRTGSSQLPCRHQLLAYPGGLTAFWSRGLPLRIHNPSCLTHSRPPLEMKLPGSPGKPQACSPPPMTTVLLPGRFHSEMAWCCSIKMSWVLTCAVPTEANVEEGYGEMFRDFANSVMLGCLYVEG